MQYFSGVPVKAQLVVRRIFSWQVFHIDKRVCVVHLFYTCAQAWFAATHVFCFAHAAHTRVPFKLWVICTAVYYIVQNLDERNFDSLLFDGK